MMITAPKNKLTKTELAKSLGISRSSLYYRPKGHVRDLIIKRKILTVLAAYPSYGHRRIALELRLNKKRIRRVMKKFNIKPYRRRPKRPIKKDDLGQPAAIYQNEIKNLITAKPNFVWAGDFTHLSFKREFIYLATIIDLFTREIVGWSVSRQHNTELILEALDMALFTTKKTPCYHHSDQGSEYRSIIYINRLKENKVIISMSEKGHPWENGFQESFYSQFKLDLGDPNRFATLGELIEEICLTIHKYNSKRIHTRLKTSPQIFRNQYLLKESLKLRAKTNLVVFKNLKNINFQTLRQSV